MRAPGLALALAAATLAGCLDPGPTGSLGDLPRLPALACPACDALASTGEGVANEPSIAANPLDPLNLVIGAHEYGTPTGDVWPGYHASFDGGASWEHGLLPGYPGDLSGPHPLTGYAVGGDASLAFAPDGTLYYAGIAFHRQLWNVALFVAVSEDGGATWPRTTFVQRGASTVIFNDKEMIAVDPRTGDVHVAWTVFRYLPSTFLGVPVDPVAAGRIHHAVSTDRGETWSLPAEISIEPLNQGAVPVFDADGTLHVAWLELAEKPGVVVRSSTSAGATWGDLVRVADVVELPSPLGNASFRVNSMPTLAAAPDGALHVAWADASNGDADVLISTSRDGGATWSAPRPVHPPSRHDQFMPWMVVDSAGRAHVLYLDRSEDPENVVYLPRLASSVDGGQSWSTIALASEGSDDRLARPRDALGREGANFIGDYSAIAAAGERVFPVWPDLRASTAGERHVDLRVAAVE